MEGTMICVRCDLPIPDGEAHYIRAIGGEEPGYGPLHEDCVLLSGLITRDDVQPLMPEDVGRKHR